ncbi:MAG: RidA family protein [Anaerolineae bacterium]
MQGHPRKRVSSGSPYEPAIGFARAMRAGQVISVSGTAPIGPDGKTVGVGDPAAQARRCLEIIHAALEQLDSGMMDVIRTRIYLTRAEDWQVVGRVHGEFFGAIRPASTMVVVAQLLDPEWRVEMEADAIASAEAGSKHE